jgi:hypothetical protein
MTRCKCGKIVLYRVLSIYQLLLLKLTSRGLLIETNEIAFYLREIFQDKCTDKLSNWTRVPPRRRLRHVLLRKYYNEIYRPFRSPFKLIASNGYQFCRMKRL